MKYFSTFTGGGGLDIGLPREWKCVGMSEVDKYASMVLRYLFPHTKNYGDIRSIDWQSVPDFDVLVGGSPCQDLSLAGKRRGLNGAKSALFAEYARCLREKKPRYFIWENVKGALSSQEGWDFAQVLTDLAEEGYVLWRDVLNAKHFGVPQNRERIFIVGSRDDSIPEIFFESQNDRGDVAEAGESEPSSQSLTTSSGHQDSTHQTYIAHTLSTRQSPPSRTQRREHENYIATTINTRGGTRGGGGRHLYRFGGSPHLKAKGL